MALLGGHHWEIHWYILVSVLVLNGGIKLAFSDGKVAVVCSLFGWAVKGDYYIGVTSEGRLES